MARTISHRSSAPAALIAALALLLAGALAHSAPSQDEFPREIVSFERSTNGPVFTGAGPRHWDAAIRERGWILAEEGAYHLWYTGYDGTREGNKSLGYATSKDGLHWTRHPENPIYQENWTEDMMVAKHGDTYYMFAEGRHDHAQLLTSKDRIHWQRIGELNIRLASGEPIPDGPYGTPTAWLEDGVWYLFYERSDRGVWLATSRDLAQWRNIQDEPVLARGPSGSYDSEAVACNQIVKFHGRYYMLYHASGTKPWTNWTTNVATSTDLIHWKKYPQNPILEPGLSSGILVPQADRFRLYTMHPQVEVHLPK
jgi:beta-1,2-mannobiose phosphorylase / 1,2-beta-oligomannan phosphorylase